MFEDITNELNEFLVGSGFKGNLFSSVIISTRPLSAAIDSLPKNYLVVCDDNLKGLAQSFFPEHRVISLGQNVIADIEIAKRLSNDYGDRTLVAFGGGTINDLCKYASFISGRSYCLFPTAASMNGYFSEFASLKISGLSRSFRAHLPRIVYVDLNIVLSAPGRLYYSGLGDLLCSVNTHLEWWRTSLYEDNGYRADLVKKLEALEDDLLSGLDVEKMLPVNFLKLMKLIFYSGLVMTVTGSSASASQSEHIFVHAFDLLFPEDATRLLHGEKVAYFTRYSLKIWEELIKLDDLFGCLEPTKYNELAKERHVLDLKCLSPEILRKNINYKLQHLIKIKKINSNEKKSWHLVRSNVVSALENSRYYSRVKIISIVAARLEPMLLSNFRVENAIKISPFIRDRFTIADLHMLASRKVEDLV